MNTRPAAAPERPVVVIGAGPGGLTAAYELCLQNVPVIILEQDKQIGGLAKTVRYKDFLFDIGGHRFFTKISIVRDLWSEVLGDDLTVRRRVSRIYFHGRFIDYPLRPLNALTNLGFAEGIRIVLSYLRVKIFPIKPEKSLADWVSNRFGRRLFRIFFKTYTEKVWGIPSDRISADWAAQRIKGLSLQSAILTLISPGGKRRAPIRTLTERFFYPRFGPGMMWNAFQVRVEAAGGAVRLESRVVKLLHDGKDIHTVEVKTASDGYRQQASHVISTMPLRELVLALDPAAPPAVLAAARRLRYRDFLTVVVIADVERIFPDNWLYIHDESVKVGRIQNFKNWSPDMVPDAAKTCLGLEYFCFEGDELWSLPDAELIDLAKRELSALGLVEPGKIVDGAVVRMPKAYPVYDEEYLQTLGIIRGHLARFRNLQVIGRNGLHKYNNMDHSMLTAILAVHNLRGEHHDLWAINTDEEYLEESAPDEAKGSPA